MTHKAMIAVSAVQYADEKGRRCVAQPGETFYVDEKHVKTLADSGSAQSVAEAAKAGKSSAKGGRKTGETGETGEPDKVDADTGETGACETDDMVG